MEQKNNPGNSEVLAADDGNELDFSQEDGLSADSGDFFESLDRKVNGMILDDNGVGEVKPQETQSKADPSNNLQPDDHQHDWEKRYKDSSKEALKMKDQLTDLSEYAPIISRLKEDTGMVDAIKTYIDNGNKPQDVKQALNLPEDFMFDLDQAVTDPNSMSAKALEHTISNVVDHRVNNKLQQDKDERKEETLKDRQAREAIDFKESHEISDNEYSEMMNWANEHKTSLEDIYFLKNRGKRDQKVATGAREDVLKQMKSVRNIPQSVSNSNSSKTERKHDDQVFDALSEVDSGLDNLFG
mgnify:CR=1 FL=1